MRFEPFLAEVLDRERGWSGEPAGGAHCEPPAPPALPTLPALPAPPTPPAPPPARAGAARPAAARLMVPAGSGPRPWRALAAGDAAVLLEFGAGIDEAVNRRVLAVAEAVRDAAPRGVWGVIPAYGTLLVEFDPLATDAADVVRAVAAAPAAGPVAAPRRFLVPTCYGGEYGPDLGEVAAGLGLAPEEVVARHTSQDFRIFCLGFSPGFPYCGVMPPDTEVRRRASPRLRVPAGSVGLAGRQTGIYPAASPGGWQIIGRTPARLFDARRDPPTPYRPGDALRFVPIDEAAYRRLEEAPPAPPALPAPLAPPPPQPVGPAVRVRVLDGGLLTSIQDLGRPRYEHLGVALGGALDAFAAAWANRLVGNEEGAALLEITLAGPTIEALDPGWVALAGADLGAEVNGEAWPPGTSRRLAPGDRIRFGTRRRGLRAYLAFAGGLRVPPVLGSRSTDVVAGFGGLDGRPLRAGDVLRYGGAGAGLRRAPVDTCRLGPDVRVLPGVRAGRFPAGAYEALASCAYTVSPHSDRVGLRLRAPVPGAGASPRGDAGRAVSEGMAIGSIQLPPGGEPVVLLGSRGTIGGYPPLAHVITADLPVLAQLAPGQPVRLRPVDPEGARAALRDLRSALRKEAEALS